MRENLPGFCNAGIWAELTHTRWEGIIIQRFTARLKAVRQRFRGVILIGGEYEPAFVFCDSGSAHND